MSDPPPVKFSDKAKNPKTAIQIQSEDLDQNFVFATLQAEEGYIEKDSGAGGHVTRRLKLPSIPSGGTHVLGAIDGALTWIETEECD
jgi:hypothetical protein